MKFHLELRAKFWKPFSQFCPHSALKGTSFLVYFTFKKRGGGEFCNLSNHFIVSTSGQIFIKLDINIMPVLTKPKPRFLIFYGVFFGATAPQWVRTSSFFRFLHHIKRRTAVGRTPLDEGSASRRDLYLNTHDIHNKQTSMPPPGFEPTISVGERPRTCALGRTVTGTDFLRLITAMWRTHKLLKTPSQTSDNFTY